MMEQLEGLQIEGKGIILRMAKASDLEAYYSFLQDAESKKLTGSNQEFTREVIADWLRKIAEPNPDRVDFMIISKETKELLGEVVLNEIDSANRSANIRIGIQGSSNRGKGHGTEAMILTLRHGFETLKLHRIHLGVYPFNPRAIHVYKKIGFQQEGIQRDALYQDGKFHDMIEMSLLEDEFRALHGENE